MSDHDTESFTPYEPQTSYEWDYGEEPPKTGGGAPPNILWGRLIALGVFTIIVFLIGRISAPNGADPEQLQRLRADYAAAQQEIENLQGAIQQPTTAATPTPSVTVGDQGDEAQDTTFDGKTYIVQSGDLMRDIAERFCGDPAKAEVIAEFNGISDPSLIRPGQELKIPEDCAE